MKAKPLRMVDKTYVLCEKAKATYLELNIPGWKSGRIVPIARAGKSPNCWTWNGSIESPTLRPILRSNDGSMCRITGGWVEFLYDGFVSQPAPLLEVK